MKLSYKGLPNIFNIAAYFLKSNLYRENGERVAFYHQDEVYSYRKVNEEVCRTAALLSKFGLEERTALRFYYPIALSLSLLFGVQSDGCNSRAD